MSNELYDEGVELDHELEAILQKFNYAVEENCLNELHTHVSKT